MAGTYPLFSVFSFLGIILVLILLPWHIKSKNSGTCFYIFWTALGSLNLLINSIIWHGNAINSAPVFCDICKLHLFVESCMLMPRLAIRINLAINVAIPASVLCIMKELYKITRVDYIVRTHSEVYIVFCFIVFPILNPPSRRNVVQSSLTV